MPDKEWIDRRDLKKADRGTKFGGGDAGKDRTLQKSRAREGEGGKKRGEVAEPKNEKKKKKKRWGEKKEKESCLPYNKNEITDLSRGGPRGEDEVTPHLNRLENVGTFGAGKTKNLSRRGEDKLERRASCYRK